MDGEENRYYGHHAAGFSDDEDFPVYPYEASIFYDAANNYDIYYDPHYQSPFEQYDLDKMMTEREEQYFANAVKKEKTSKKKQQQEPKKEHYGVPFRREADKSPYEPRSTRRNAIFDNETPMYVRPYLEDPIFLQPDDGEVSLLHPDLAHPTEHQAGHDKQHDLQGDPSLESPSSQKVE